MPFVSKAQSRFMHWAAAHPKAAERERHIKPGIAAEFVQAGHGQKLGQLPERVQHKADGGAVHGTPRPFKW